MCGVTRVARYRGTPKAYGKTFHFLLQLSQIDMFEKGADVCDTSMCWWTNRQAFLRVVLTVTVFGVNCSDFGITANIEMCHVKLLKWPRTVQACKRKAMAACGWNIKTT